MRKVLQLLVAASLAGCAPAAPTPTPLDVHVGGIVEIDVRDGANRYVYTWPGVYFEARFKGPSLTVDIDDEHNELHLFVDGEVKMILQRPGRQTFSIDDLGAGEHTVRLVKVTETQGPTGSFLGFTVPSEEAALPPPTYTRAIEFFGDSNSVGYGNESPVRECTPDELWDRTNTSLAFGPLTARHFEADYRMLASSGYGVVRNYAGGNPGDSLPIMAEASLEASTQDFSPDVIVVGLGDNDFSTPLDDNEAWATQAQLRAIYRTKYVAFVARQAVRAPDARIVLLAPDLFLDEVRAVRDVLAAGGIDQVTVMHLTGLEKTGCDWHNSLADHRKLADQLIELLDELEVFSQGS